MKTTTEVTIAGAEGLGQDLSSVGCYVSLDGRLHDVITPLNNQPGPDTAVLLPHEGQVRFIVKNMGGDDHVFGSVSLPLSLLPDTPGQLWLPLFERLDGDLIHDLPVEVDCPKILLILGTVSLLSPVQELTEGSRSSIEEDLEELHQGLLSRDPQIFDTPNKFRRSEHDLEKSEWRLRVSTDDLQSQYFQDRDSWTSLTHRQSLLISDLQSQSLSFEKLYKQEQSRCSVLTTKLAALNEQYESAQERMIERERVLMETIDEKVMDVSHLHVQITELQESLRNLTSDKYQIEELYRQLQTQIDGNSVPELQESLNLAVEQLAESEIARRKLQEELNTSINLPNFKDLCGSENLTREISILREKIGKLEGILEEKAGKEAGFIAELTQLRPLKDAYRAADTELCQQRESVAVLSQENANFKDEISALSSLLKDSHTKNSELQADLNSLKLENGRLMGVVEDYKRRPIKTGEVVDYLVGKWVGEKTGSVQMQKVGEELYVIGSKRVCLTVRGGGLSVRVGSGYLFLDDYLKLYHPHEHRHADPLSESTNSLTHFKVSPNRSLSVESKSHRRVSTMPESGKETQQQGKGCEPDDELFNSANTSHVKQFVEIETENMPENTGRGEDLYTPSPIKKLAPCGPGKPNKTPKTPGRRAPSVSKVTGKSLERLPRKAPFR